ncbi:hypothetical protein AVEN_153358-1 [Araneus ventricosus]|uniref:Uncharacterized protein n=1 Tax=Araneus ventricosus TaxID=182803 RepID=A0A4Y2QNR2_ARAVE|nr:hypothetical protein AVEN_153358-1 [Araneus ventricosus]
MGLKEATIRANQGNEITEIWTDSLWRVMAVLDPHTPHQFVRDIQSLLTQNRNILVRWIKAHDCYLVELSPTGGTTSTWIKSRRISKRGDCAPVILRASYGRGRAVAVDGHYGSGLNTGATAATVSQLHRLLHVK